MDEMSESGIAPPFDLYNDVAYEHWKRHAGRIYSEGRAGMVNLDALAAYCDSLSMYADAMMNVRRWGVCYTGVNGGEVKNPAMSVLATLRNDMARLTRTIPLYDNTSGGRDEFSDFMADAEEWANAAVGD